MILIGIMTFATVTSCSDDDIDDTYVDVSDSDDEEEYAVFTEQPVSDQVVTTFGGKVALLQSGGGDSNILSYLTKRFENTVTELTDDADVVVLDETRAQGIMADSDEYDMLSYLWETNKIIAFLSPDRNAYILWDKLRSTDADDANVADADLTCFENIDLFATRADGVTLFHQKSGTSSGIEEALLTSQDESGETQERLIMSNLMNGEDTSPNDYVMGRGGEGIAGWLNENALTGEQPHVAFTRAGEEYDISSATTTYLSQVTVSHDWVKTVYKSSLNLPPSTTVDVSIKMQVSGVYNAKDNQDWYDVNIYETFPADKTFVKNALVRKSASYKYKYTGGCYYGPEVLLTMLNVDSSDIELEQAAPLPASGGSYSKTHNPMGISFGTSLTGNVSSSDIGLSGGFSMNVTLPSTTVSFSHAEMPINYSDSGKTPHWEYSTDYDVYDLQWGFNPKYKDVPDVVHSYCKTDQAVTFIVNDSRKYGSKRLWLASNVNFQVYNEFGYYKKGWSFVDMDPHYFEMQLPQVNRYFEKYTPYPMPGHSGKADSSDWANLESRLKNNINYRSLCDDMLKVGAQSEGALDGTAEKIWRTALESIVKQYNGTPTTNEYVIGLGKTNGSHIKLGLHISNSKWSIVENVDNVK